MFFYQDQYLLLWERQIGKEFDRLEAEGILQKVSYSEWDSPVVPVDSLSVHKGHLSYQAAVKDNVMWISCKRLSRSRNDGQPENQDGIIVVIQLITEVKLIDKKYQLILSHHWLNLDTQKELKPSRWLLILKEKCCVSRIRPYVTVLYSV